MRLAPIVALLALGSCGYSFTQRYVAGGADRIHAAAFENLSTDPGLGAALTSALREELARRGSDAGAEASTWIEGEVGVEDPVPTSVRAVGGVETWRIAVIVGTRLVRDGETIARRELRREVDYLGGGDPLETEGLRALALRRLAVDTAREILRSFEDSR